MRKNVITVILSLYRGGKKQGEKHDITESIKK